MNGRNPLLPLSICIPDGEAHTMPDGRLYVYGSLDENKDGFCSGRYRVASTRDLKNWEVTESPSFSVDAVPWAGASRSKKHSSLSLVKSIADLPAHIQALLPPDAGKYPIEQIVAAIEQHADEGLPKDIRLYAPDAISKDGMTYLYFCLSDDTEGVAVSKKPEGPFCGAKKLSVTGIDPAVFVDDDGCAYYYWGQFSANAARLNPDMMSLDESSIVNGILTEQEHHFHEGSSLRKRGDTYYYVFADVSRGRPCCLGYATSKSPLGPFTYQGVILDNGDCDPKCWNIHGSIEEWNGQWYVFYHRSSNNSQYLRRLCCEPIFFDENGRIPEVKMTSQGAGEPLRPGEWIPAGLGCAFSGWAYLDTEGGSEALVRMPVEGSAVFRYLETDAPLTQVLVKGLGEGSLSILCDGVMVGKGCANTAFTIAIAPGVHEFVIEAADGPFTLIGFQLF